MNEIQAKSQPPDIASSSLQELFDYVVSGLVRQGMPSIGFIGCKYRGPGDCKCAIGMLIPDEKYDSIIEGQSVVGAFRELKLSYGDEEKLSFLAELQRSHDNTASYAAYNTEEKWLTLFKKRAGELAEGFRLNTTVLSAQGENK